MTQVKYINKEVLKKALSNGKQLALNSTQMTSCKTNFQAKIQPYLSAQVEAPVQLTVQEPAVAQATPAVQEASTVQNVVNNPIPDAPVVNPIEMNTQPVMGIENDVAAVSAPQPVVMENPALEVSSDVNMMGAQSTEDSDRITREVMQLNVEMSKKIDEEIKMVNKRIAEITSEYNNKIITLTNELISKKKMNSAEMNVSNPGVSPVNSVVDTSEMTQVAEGPTLNLKIA